MKIEDLLRMSSREDEQVLEKVSVENEEEEPNCYSENPIK